MKKIECVIMDWAGTAVDYGCFAPVSAFIESFNAIGISITAEEARRPMGLTKIDHIRALFQMERIGEAFYQKYGRKYKETRPISDGFKKNNVNYWVFRDLCSIILHS